MERSQSLKPGLPPADADVHAHVSAAEASVATVGGAPGLHRSRRGRARANAAPSAIIRGTRCFPLACRRPSCAGRRCQSTGHGPAAAQAVLPSPLRRQADKVPRPTKSLTTESNEAAGRATEVTSVDCCGSSFSSERQLAPGLGRLLCWQLVTQSRQRSTPLSRGVAASSLTIFVHPLLQTACPP